MKNGTLAKRIKSCGHSMQKLARMTGVPFSTIRSIASGGTKHPRIDTAEKLEKALGK